MIRLLVADDHAAARAGMVALTAGTDISVVAEAATCEEAVAQALKSAVDVVLLDVRMPATDGFHALEQIKAAKPTLPVLLFSVSDTLRDISRAHHLGAAGFVSKAQTRDAILLAIEKAAAGKSAWTRQQLRRVRNSASAADELVGDHTVDLTPREHQVLQRLVEGLVNDDIGEVLGVDVETVKQHVKHILRKLGVEDRTQAAVWAVRHRAV